MQHLAHVETLESRRLLSGTLATVDLSDGVLDITGTNRLDTIIVRGDVETLDEGTLEVDDGVTSVGLNFDALAAAASLGLAGVDGAVNPADGPFVVGFDITEGSDFRYTTDGGLLGGTIRHTGTVIFDILDAAGNPTGDQVTVGDFDIGFDPARAVDGNSGLFVADTASGLGILFDVGAPDSLGVSDTLEVGRADLKVSPEFAAFLLDAGLAAADLTGVVVGDAASSSTGVSERDIFQVNAFRLGSSTPTPFDAGLIDTINIDAAGGRDIVIIRDLDRGTATPVDVKIDTGRGRDSVTINGNELGDIEVYTDRGRDRVTFGSNAIAGDVFLDTGRGRDTVFFSFNDVGGGATLLGGGGRDFLLGVSNTFEDDLVIESFTRPFPGSLTTIV